MAFEYVDERIKATLLLYRGRKNKIKLAGFVRFTDEDGETTMRMTTAVDTSREFDDIEFIEEHPEPNSEVGLINMNQYGLETI